MKKTGIILIALSLFCFSAYAQSPGEVRIGGGLALGTEAAIDDNGNETLGLGINVGGEYLFTENISIAPSFTWYFPSTFENPAAKVSFNISSLNIDGRYYFFSEGVEVYGMAGLALAFARAESENKILNQTVTTSDSEVGLNIGAGMNYPFSEVLRGNLQVKYHTEFEMAVINFGVAYSIK